MIHGCEDCEHESQQDLNARPGNLYFPKGVYVCVCVYVWVSSQVLILRRKPKGAAQEFSLFSPHISPWNKGAHVKRDSHRQAWECEVFTVLLVKRNWRMCVIVTCIVFKVVGGDIHRKMGWLEWKIWTGWFTRKRLTGVDFGFALNWMAPSHDVSKQYCKQTG